jgi:hypothetical protein
VFSQSLCDRDEEQLLTEVTSVYSLLRELHFIAAGCRSRCLRSLQRLTFFSFSWNKQERYRKAAGKLGSLRLQQRVPERFVAPTQI